MLTDISVFNAAAALMTYNNERQKLLTGNVANAATPGYVGRDMKPFTLTDLPLGMNATRSGHLNGTRADDPYAGGREVFKSFTSDETLNHNKVSVEQELAKAAENQGSHAMAAAIWQKSLDILRMTTGKN